MFLCLYAIQPREEGAEYLKLCFSQALLELTVNHFFIVCPVSCVVLLLDQLSSLESGNTLV